MSDIRPQEEDVTAAAESILIAVCRTRDWSVNSLCGGQGVILALHPKIQKVLEETEKLIQRLIDEEIAEDV